MDALTLTRIGLTLAFLFFALSAVAFYTVAHSLVAQRPRMPIKAAGVLILAAASAMAACAVVTL